MKLYPFDICLIDYPKLKLNIQINNDQFCSDKICCFKPPNGDGENINPYGDNLDIILVIGSITSPESNNYNTIEDLVMNQECGIKYSLFPACSRLVPEFKRENQNLIIAWRCSDYNKRPEACKTYPDEKACDFDKYCRRPDEQELIAKVPAIMFYGLENNLVEKIKKIKTEQEIDLKQFSIGEIKKYSITGIKNYFLIPIPTKRPENPRHFAGCRIREPTTQSC